MNERKTYHSDKNGYKKREILRLKMSIYNNTSLYRLVHEELPISNRALDSHKCLNGKHKTLFKVDTSL